MCQICELGSASISGLDSALGMLSEKLPARVLRPGVVIHFLVNDQDASVMTLGRNNFDHTFLGGENGAKLGIRVFNNTSEPIVAVTSLNGLNVVNGESATRDGAGVLVLPGTTCNINSWYDGNYLRLGSTPGYGDGSKLPNEGIIGLQCYGIASEANRSIGTHFLDFMVGMNGSTPKWKRREGVWENLRTGQSVDPSLVKRSYPAMQTVIVRYGSKPELLEKGIDMSGTVKDADVDPWWTTSAFPGDDLSYSGGLPKEESRTSSDSAPSAQRVEAGAFR